jgi:hypothetical protein
MLLNRMSASSGHSVERESFKTASAEHGDHAGACLNNGGTLERPMWMANHANARTTRLYDRNLEETLTG